MELANHLQIEIKDLIEIPVLGSGFCQDHRQVQAHGSYIEAPYKYRLILVIRRIHSASYIPGAEESPAAHGADDLFISFVHAGDIAFSAERKPVRIHGLCRAGNPRFKDVFPDLTLSVYIFIVQEHDLGEQHRFLVPFLSLASLMYFQKGDAAHLLEALHAKSQCHCHKRIIPSGGSYRVQLVLDSLPALVIVSSDLIHGILFRSVLCLFPGRIHIFEKFFFILRIAFFRIGSQDLIHLRYGKAAVLLRRSA